MENITTEVAQSLDNVDNSTAIGYNTSDHLSGGHVGGIPAEYLLHPQFCLPAGRWNTDALQKGTAGRDTGHDDRVSCRRYRGHADRIRDRRQWRRLRESVHAGADTRRHTECRFRAGRIAGQDDRNRYALRKRQDVHDQQCGPVLARRQLSPARRLDDRRDTEHPQPECDGFMTCDTNQ